MRLLTAAIFALVASTLFGASIPLRWDPVTHPDLVGYRIYYGPASGNYTANFDVGNVTSVTLGGLEECAEYFLAVRARSAVGEVSDAPSNEIHGWPRPVIAVPDDGPYVLHRGVETTLRLVGASFRPGSMVNLPGMAADIVAIESIDCWTIDVTVIVDADAAPGLYPVEVEHPDTVFGFREDAIEIPGFPAPGNFHRTDVRESPVAVLRLSDSLWAWQAPCEQLRCSRAGVATGLAP